MMKRAPLLPLLVLASHCGGGADNLPPPPPPPPPPVLATPTPAPAETPVSKAPEAKTEPAVELLLGTAAPNPPAPTPTVRFLAPTRGQVIPNAKAQDFEIKLDVKNWKTASNDAHVHLILDNRPYKPIYDTKKPVKMAELLSGAALDEGQHVLIAFPSRASHESVKTSGALSVLEFFVGKKEKAKVDVQKPLLIYSRPKGDYKGDMANHVLIDFQLSGATLAKGKQEVQVTVTGPGIDGDLKATAEAFGAPFFLNNLRTGDYSVRLELLDGGKTLAPSLFNPTTRSIHVERDAPTESGHDAHEKPAGDAGK